MTDFELELKEKYKPVASLPDEDLKKFAKDIYNNLIFTDRHCKKSEISMRFMVLMFMGPSSKKDKREDSLYTILEMDMEEKAYKEYLSSIGMVYEYMSQGGGVSINAGPTFMSCRFLNKEDTVKVWDYYEKYKEIRETADNF